MAEATDRTLAAAGLVLVYASIIGFTDNFVRVVAAEVGLWQFHATRSIIALVLLGVAGVIIGLRLRPVNAGAVAGRSAIHGIAMLIYFGSLAFLPVAQVAAGLFTAPIFVLLISRLIYGHPIGPVRVIAVALGFLGVLMVLGPSAMGDASLAALLPIIAGALYAFGNVITREWCREESAETLLAGFFVALAILGALGMVLLGFFPVAVPEGTDGFIQRGFVVPSAMFWVWMVMQAAGALFAIGLSIRAYLIADASRVSVFEYVILLTSAFWGWVLWSETLSPLAILGMALIAAAGAIIALRARQMPPTASRQWRRQSET
ncbi:MAG: EamA/RhaT family transporter [Cereibacter sphaeroides]|uniref:EamA/RhaT family transporter n=1 Tax=Cereibacter sphaeroides TaxID=1063 RepID=A0A2W5UD03_CERSP|nr:MAG: EamA/RhaT family transporter [Cereibacter sphaeroides]